MEDRQLEQQRADVARTMEIYGGGFMSKIGAALAHADIKNTRKIYDTWPEEWDRYLYMSGVIKSRNS